MQRVGLFTALLMTWVVATAAEPERIIELPDQQARLLGIATAAAVAVTHLGHDNLIGEVQLPLAGSAAVATPYAGRVLSVAVDEGDRVSAGQGLAVLASRDYAEQRARLQRGAVDLELLRKQATRDQALHDAGIIPDTRLETSRAALASAVADMAALRATVGTLLPASGADSFTLKAPIAGRIVARHVTPGAALDELALAFVIASDNGWRLNVAVPFKLAQDLDSGASLRVGAIEVPIAGRSFSIDSATQSIQVRAQLPADSGLAPGQRVTVSLLLPAPAGAVGVPRAALTRVAEQAYLFVQRSSGYAWLPVAVLGESGEQSVVSGELAVGEAVVSRGVSALKALLAD